MRQSKAKTTAPSGWAAWTRGASACSAWTLPRSALPALLTTLLAALLASLLWAQPASAVPVIPAGQESRVGRLLGEGESLAGCKLERAEIAAEAIFGHWRCPGGAASLRARNGKDPSAADRVACGHGGGLELAAVASVGAAAPESEAQALCAALAARLQADPDRLRWQDVAQVAPPADAPPKVEAPAQATAAGDEAAGPKRTAGGGDFEGLPKAVAEAYYATDGLMRQSLGREILDRLGPLARQHRHPLLLGRLVVAAAAIAGSHDGDVQVERLLDEAKARPDDDIAQFVAGVAVHYRGHVRGATREAKSADYSRALTLLEPLRDRLQQSPRLWIYLAVSYHRTGRAKQAEDAIARAVAGDSGTDADVFYCRAEVYHQREPARAVQDIDRYIEMMRENRARGAWSAPEKERKVGAMRDKMARVAAGVEAAPAPDDHGLFDPVRVAIRDDGGGMGMDLAFVVAFGLAIALAALAVVIRR